MTTMKLTKFFVPFACGFSALQLVVPASHADDLRVEPVIAVRHADVGADALYQLGRHHQQGNQLDEAAAAYRAALEKDANYIEARNALATVYFIQKDMRGAVAELQTVLQKQPGLSHIHSNLGYVYLQDNNYPAALSAFAQAIMIDPANTRAFGNLTLAYERLDARVKQARAAATATTTATTTASVPRQAAQPDEKGPAAPAATLARAPAAENAAPQAPAVPAPATGIEIEIANGTRDPAAAGRIAETLRTQGVNVVRMAGLAPYTQQRTVILYRAGHRQAALALSSMFAVPPAVASDTRKRDAQDRPALRLVLGKTAAQAERLAATPQPAAAR
jgi:tetratricopeptide (TPR) repeat protein